MAGIPPRDAIEAWHRTLIARRSPDYETGIAWAWNHEPSPDELMDLEQLASV